MMDSTRRIVSFDTENPPPPGIVARLHAELFPRSPLTKLGVEFMERFYYVCLPEDGAIFSAVAYVAGEPAGFVVATRDSAGFMKETLRRHWSRISRVLASSLISKPSSVIPVWEAIQIMRGRRATTSVEQEGEILSIGVLPAFRDSSGGPSFHLAAELLATAVDPMLASGTPLIRAIVDKDNEQAHRFYRSQGWTMESYNVPGWEVPSVEFVLRTEFVGAENYSWERVGQLKRSSLSR